MTSKLYKCYICNKKLEDRSKMRRLVYQKYVYHVYGKFINVKNIDLCNDCTKEFKSWIKNKKLIGDKHE